MPCRSPPAAPERRRSRPSGTVRAARARSSPSTSASRPATVTANEQIDYRWTVGRAFSAKPLPLGLALGLLVLGGIGARRAAPPGRRRRRDGRRSAGPGSSCPSEPGQTEFRVVGDVRPGHVGTRGRRAGRPDRRHRQPGRPGGPRPPADHRAAAGVRVRADRVGADPDGRPPTGCVRSRQKLLDGIAPAGGTVRVSELASRVHESIGAVQDKLYDEVVVNGWYERRPDATRNRWTQLAPGRLIVAVVVTGAARRLHHVRPGRSGADRARRSG